MGDVMKVKTSRAALRDSSVTTSKNIFRKPGLFLCAASLAGLTACVEPTAEYNADEAPTAPEYLSCESVPQALKQADYVVRQLGTNSSSVEAEYWQKRQERLIARAYECKG